MTVKELKDCLVGLQDDLVVNTLDDDASGTEDINLYISQKVNEPSYLLITWYNCPRRNLIQLWPRK